VDDSAILDKIGREVDMKDLDKAGCGSPNDATRQARFNGSRFLRAGSGITVGCISPEARDCLDRVMEEWKAHKSELKKVHGGHYRPGEYGFAYWLIRWSGLVKPASNLDTVASDTANLNQNLK
jgi:hypothetical protein